MKYKDNPSIDSIIVDLIIDHYNVQSFESTTEKLSSKQFDEIVEIAESIYFLAASNTYITGQLLSVTGGE